MGLLYQLILRERGVDTVQRVVLGSGGIRLLLYQVGLQVNYVQQFQRWLFYFCYWRDGVLWR